MHHILMNSNENLLEFIINQNSNLIDYGKLHYEDIPAVHLALSLIGNANKSINSINCAKLLIKSAKNSHQLDCIIN
jgi:hypothetical protein